MNKNFIIISCFILLSSCIGKTEKEKSETDSFPAHEKYVPNQESVIWQRKGLSVYKDHSRDSLECGLKYFDKAIAYDLKNENAYYNKMQYLLDLGRKEEALATADSLIKNIPERSAGYVQRAVLLKYIGQEGTASQESEEALRTALEMVERDLHRKGESAVLSRHLFNRAIVKTLLKEKGAYEELVSMKPKYEQCFTNEWGKEVGDSILSILKRADEKELYILFLHPIPVH